MSTTISLRPLPLLLATLAFGALAGCGGTDSVVSDTIPTTTLEFQGVSSDYNGGSASIPSTAGSVTASTGTTTIFATAGARTVEITIPTASFTPGRTLNFSSAAAATSRYTTQSPTDATLAWKADLGSVRIVSSSGTGAVVQIRNARYVADGSTAGAAGSFTLSGTITATPVIN